MQKSCMRTASAAGARPAPAHLPHARSPSCRRARPFAQPGRQQRRTFHHVAQAQLVETQQEALPDTSASSTPSTSGAEYRDVDEVRGVRYVLVNDEPTIQYRVKWKDGSPDTWEVPNNIADNLIRDFDDRWWTAAKKADDETLAQMLAYGKDVLSQVVDENRRSALHFAAGLGNMKAVELLLEAGADIDLQDKEGYTPLHMAAGYMQTRAMNVLLKAGANPALKDYAGRDIATLVEGLKQQLGLSPAQLPRRMALEEVTNNLLDALYEEVAPRQILEMRELEGAKQYLVQFDDGRDDEWVPEGDLSEELVADWAAGLELAEAEGIVDHEQRGTSRKFLLRWRDGHPDTWEPEEHVAEALVAAYVEQHPELRRRGKGAKKGKSKRKAAAGNGNGVAAAAAEQAKAPAGVA